MTTEIKRDHEGRLHLFTHGVPVPGATVTGVKMLTSGDIAAEVYIPTRHLMPDIAAGAIPVVFGDFSGYLVIDRMGIRILRDPYSAKPYVQFYTTKRVGGGIVDPTKLRYHTVGGGEATGGDAGTGE